MNIYETHKMQDVRIPFIFHDSTVSLYKQSTTYNWHENIEIIYVVSGNGVAVCDGKRVEMQKGDIVIVNANRLHGYFAESEKMRYFCIIIDRSFFIGNHFDSNDYTFENVVRDEKAAGLIEAFAEEWKKEDSPMRVQKLRAFALDIAVLLCDRYGEYDTAPKEEPRITAAVKQAIGYVRAESEKDISLDRISAFVGISKYYFSREFRRVTGYSFVEYLNIVRCENAKKMLLDENLSVGEVGRACGFKNMSYFTRTFLLCVGVTPREYRKKN